MIAKLKKWFNSFGRNAVPAVVVAVEYTVSAVPLLVGVDPKADKILAHVFDFEVAQLPNLVTSHATHIASSLVVAQRLINAYHLSLESVQSANYTRVENDLWSDILEKEFAELILILNQKDAHGLVEYLMHFGESYMWFGGLCFSLDGYNHRNKTEQHIAASYFDKLICLAEAVGARPHENPEQGPWGENVKLGVDVLTALIEQVTGTSLKVPQGIVPITGIESQIGPIHYRHVNAFYAAWRAKTLLGAHGKAVCEFGAGNGIAAFYAHQMGVASYTTLDLPLTNVFSGWFLINALGADMVHLQGEVASQAGVTLLPSWRCADIESNAFDLVLNQDSFPEIDKTLLQRYFEIIQKTSSKYFLSINHETETPMASVKHSSVPKLLKYNPHFVLLSRSKYWVREGYVEELYQVIK